MHYLFIMKHATILFLIFAILSSGLAWSLDSHSEAFFGHASEAGFLNGDPSDQPDDVINDHCCHATAHMAGLFSPSKEVFNMPQHHTASYASSRFYSLSIAPPTPPPIA